MGQSLTALLSLWEWDGNIYVQNSSFYFPNSLKS